MLKLFPALKDYVWGGTRLRDIYGRDKDCTLDRVSESWEVSIHPDGPSTLQNGETLASYLEKNPQAVDKKGRKFPILIKYIDALQNLSVQVHPNDAYARKNENDNGKTEMWYILSADEGAGIYCGFARDTNKKEFLEKVKDGTVEEMLNFIPVKAGDCFLIEAGTVHAICKGCLICEIQQSSNVTYRVYDYNRMGVDGKPRALHVDKAVDVINFKKFKDNTGTKAPVESERGSSQHLTACAYFSVEKVTLAGGLYNTVNENSFTAVCVLSGEGVINGEAFKGGDSFFLSAGENIYIKGNATLLLATE